MSIYSIGPRPCDLACRWEFRLPLGSVFLLSCPDLLVSFHTSQLPRGSGACVEIKPCFQFLLGFVLQMEHVV